MKITPDDMAFIIERAKSGETPRRIHAALGRYSRQGIAKAIWRARALGETIPQLKKMSKKPECPASGMHIRVEADLAHRFERPATLRGIPERDLIYRLITVIAQDNLVDSILDDR